MCSGKGLNALVMLKTQSTMQEEDEREEKDPQSGYRRFGRQAIDIPGEQRNTWPNT